jgi:hypothetical protein
MTEFAKYVVLLLYLTKRIGASEGVIMCRSFDCVLKWSTLPMNKDSANAALVCDTLAFLSTGFASELDLLPRGKECVLMAVVSTNSPTRNTFDIDVKIAGETTVEEGSRAILAAHITTISQ